MRLPEIQIDAQRLECLAHVVGKMRFEHQPLDILEIVAGETVGKSVVDDKQDTSRRHSSIRPPILGQAAQQIAIHRPVVWSSSFFPTGVRRPALDRPAHRAVAMEPEPVVFVVEGRELPKRERAIILMYAEKDKASKEKRRVASIFGGPPKPATSGS